MLLWSCMFNFYPRPPCGGRQMDCGCTRVSNCISIHALRVEGDNGAGVFLCNGGRFLSTPSVWRATRHRGGQGTGTEISIHALRVEGDGQPRSMCACPANFYPRPPCGGRQEHRLRIAALKEFLSTPSVWRATASAASVASSASSISIHALRVEGDARCGPARWAGVNFYPRPPCGGRPVPRAGSCWLG